MQLGCNMSVHQCRGATGWGEGASSVGGVLEIVHCRCALWLVDGVVEKTTQFPRQAAGATWHWGRRIPFPWGPIQLMGIMTLQDPRS